MNSFIQSKHLFFNFRSFVFGLLSLVFGLLSVVPIAYACPFCKEALAKMGEIWTAVGFNVSVYLMLAVPFILVGSFVLILYLHYQKRRGS